MLDLLEQNRDAIRKLCQECRVRRLEVFGSAARGDFDPARSDIDLFYEFDPNDNKDLADRFFTLQQGLEKVLGRQVELVSLADATNPYFLRVAMRDCLQLYAA
jgi:predicted nucleotidyltransferase